MPRLDEVLKKELDQMLPVPEIETLRRQADRRRARRRLVVLAQRATLVVVVLAGTAAGTYGLSKIFRGAGEVPRPAGPGGVRNGRIAFSYSKMAPGMQITTVEPDGSDPVKIDNGGVGAGDPQFSPDGKEIVFTSLRPIGQGPGNIFVMDSDGSDVRKLTDYSSWDMAPAWSSDGSQIVFTSWRNEPPRGLWVMDADGSNQRPLTEGAPLAEISDADWSPDGRWIVAHAYEPGGGRSGLVLLRPDGSDLSWIAEPESAYEGLTFQPDWGLLPDWSPEGARIAYVGISRSLTGSARSPEDAPWFAQDVFTVDVRTGQRTELNLPVQRPWAPTWSPDGRYIAFFGCIGGGCDSGPGNDRQESLWVAGADGSDPHVVIPVGPEILPSLSGISWSAQGEPEPVQSVSIAPELLEPMEQLEGQQTVGST